MKKLFGILLVLAAGLKLANGNNLPNNSARSFVTQTQQSSGPARRNAQRNSTLQQFAVNSVTPAYRSQMHRLGSPGKIYFSVQNSFSSYHNTLSSIFLHLNAGYVRWCKLVLYPFHAFW